MAAGDWVRLGLVAGREAAVVEEEREAEASGCRSGARLAEEALLLALADASGAASVRGAACPASSCGRTPAFSSGGRLSVSPPVSSVWEAAELAAWPCAAEEAVSLAGPAQPARVIDRAASTAVKANIDRFLFFIRIILSGRQGAARRVIVAAISWMKCSFVTISWYHGPDEKGTGKSRKKSETPRFSSVFMEVCRWISQSVHGFFLDKCKRFH